MRKMWFLLVLFCMLSPLLYGTEGSHLALFVQGDDDFALYVKEIGKDILRRDRRFSILETTYRQDVAQKQAQLKKWQDLSTAYGKEDDLLALPSAMVGKLDLGMKDDITVDLLEEDEDLAAIFSSGSPSFFCDFYGYDYLIFPKSVQMAGHKRCTIDFYVRSTDTLTRIYDQLSFNENYMENEAPLTLALLSCVESDELAVITLKDTPPSFLLSVDGTDMMIRDDLVVLPIGKHTLVMSAYGYESKEMDVLLSKGETLSVDGSLVPKVMPSLTLLSTSGNVNWTIDGVKAGTASLLSLGNVSLPILLQADKEGFLPMRKQASESKDVMYFSLKPLWAEGEGLLRDKQKAFYGSFVSFAVATCVMLAHNALYQVYGNGEVYSPIAYYAEQGAVVMTGMLLVRHLFEYTGHILDM